MSAETPLSRNVPAEVAPPTPLTPEAPDVTHDERYARQRSLPGFGAEAQMRLRESSVLIVGVGGIGWAAAAYLVGVGVGRVGLVDDDRVAASNLHRQLLYRPKDVGRPKVVVAAERLLAQNPAARIDVHDTRFGVDDALDLVADYGLVLDCSDNFATRYLLSDACVMKARVLVYGAAQGFEGQVAVFGTGADDATYRCLYPFDAANAAIPDCASGGVLGVLPGLVGTYQALETVKVLTGVGEPLLNQLLVIDGLSTSHLNLRITPVPANRARRALELSYTAEADVGAVTEVPIDELDALLARGAQVIDLRTAAERAVFALPTTQHLPVEELAERLDELDLSVPIYLLCASGARSLRAARLISELRPAAEILHLFGGLAAYRALSHEVAMRQ